MNERALFLLDDRRQAQFARQIFAGTSVSLTIVASVEELCDEIEKGTGVVLLTQYSLSGSGGACLFDILNRQPSWSEIPVIVLVSPRDKKTTTRNFADNFPTDVVLLDAPVRVRTLMSVVRTALRSRRRQYAVRDLIERLKQAEAQEHEARKAAEAASHAKAEFLASMSHDLRTPLSGVIGMLGLTSEMDIDDETRSYIQMAERSAESLLRLINDILDFSRAEAGRMVFVSKAFSVREAVQTAVEAVLVEAIQKGLHLETAIADNVPEQVMGDEGRLRQVLVNLLGNSVKFTAHGGIQVTVDRDDADLLRFSVSDTGIGIGAEKLDRIFGRYIQGDESILGRYGGTGIGLALSNELVDKMGGRIQVESKVGVGSTFSILLPLPQA